MYNEASSLFNEQTVHGILSNTGVKLLLLVYYTNSYSATAQAKQYSDDSSFWGCSPHLTSSTFSCPGLNKVKSNDAVPFISIIQATAARRSFHSTRKVLGTLNGSFLRQQRNILSVFFFF